MVFSSGERQKNSYSLLLAVAVLSAITFILVLYLVVSFSDSSRVGSQASQGIGQLKGASSIQPGAPGSETISVSGGDPAVEEVVKKVARHVLLPGGKVTVATALDPDALRKEEPIFYARASKGDKVLFYIDRAVLYSPVMDLVLEMAYIRNDASAPKPVR